MTILLKDTIKILGIPFFKGSAKECYEYLNEKGGLLTAPSGPGLANIPNDKLYYKSLLNSDLVIPDSGYMALIWNIYKKTKISRLSGLEFINYFVESFPAEIDKRIFLINPTQGEQEANLTYLSAVGIPVAVDNCYIAPVYIGGKVKDETLLNLIEKRKPRWVLINIGGGTQEILGSYLKNHLSYLPALVCTGAAIAFKTGKQVDIPVWADKFYLGWLFRIASSPKKYFKRYWEAVPLVKLLLKYGENTVRDFVVKK